MITGRSLNHSVRSTDPPVTQSFKARISYRKWIAGRQQVLGLHHTACNLCWLSQAWFFLLLIPQQRLDGQTRLQTWGTGGPGGDPHRRGGKQRNWRLSTHTGLPSIQLLVLDEAAALLCECVYLVIISKDRAGRPKSVLLLSEGLRLRGRLFNHRSHGRRLIAGCWEKTGRSL